MHSRERERETNRQTQVTVTATLGHHAASGSSGHSELGNRVREKERETNIRQRV